jgi:hypothetical protein
MIADQKWAKDAPVDGLNPDWLTSYGRLFFDAFPDRLEGCRRANKWADMFIERRAKNELRDKVRVLFDEAIDDDTKDTGAL